MRTTARTEAHRGAAGVSRWPEIVERPLLKTRGRDIGNIGFLFFQQITGQMNYLRFRLPPSILQLQ